MDNNLSSNEVSEEQENESNILRAEIVYVILRKSCYVSRSLRIQWFLQHLNTKIRISKYGMEEKNNTEEIIISVIPLDRPKNWSSENAYLYEYVVSLNTNVIFLGEVYRQVYCLDISPSVSTVDIQQGEVLVDLIIKALKKSIKFLIKPFIIPGSSHLFQPLIFITVIAHTPFYISPAQQVLVQGWKISQENINEFLEAVLRQLEFIENTVAQVSGAIHEEFDRERKKSLMEQIELKKSTERLCKEDHDVSFTPFSPNIAMVSPGSGFLNLLRYGMLALKLLPVSNFSNLVVITDGMIIMPDSDTLDSVLNHMRYNDIACYFLHVGSQFHPHCGFGFVPYTEIMQLISVATNGVYMQFPPQHKEIGGIGVYQHNFLTWSLKRKSVILDLSTPHPRDGEWNVSNRHFCGNRSPQLLVKKYLENDINVTLYGVLACRIREGFILKDIFIRESQELVIDLILPWTNHIYIEYTVSCQWPLVITPAISAHYIMNIKAPYEFLHDISCRMRMPIKSPFRQALIARFWRSLKSFAQSDLLLSHLESFMNNVSSYYLPEILKNGMPLYHLTPGSCQLNVASSDVTFTQFGSIWRPACLLNNNLWQKWFHPDRVGVIFKHDEPLNLFPQNLRSATITCASMQCRQATNTLFNFLKSYCSFSLIENHSFIKFLLPNESGTGKYSFVVIRSIFKPPYAVIHIAFLYNIPARVRMKFLKDFKRSISALKIPRMPLQKDSYDIIFGSRKSNIISNSFNSQLNCCILLDKPLEKILIRYEQMPKEFKTVVFPDGTQPSAKSSNTLSVNRGLITTLSRYLHHRRWIWKTEVGNNTFLSAGALKTVLSTLIKIRLQEGFYFAHCSAGICSMILEVQMEGTFKNKDDTDGIYYDCHNVLDDNEEPHSCIIQYVIFSPKTIVLDKDDDENENNIKIVELVTECWIEPQHGVITGCPPVRNYMLNLQYHQLPDALWSVDVKCISALYTFEYLRLACENANIEIPQSIQNLLTQSKSSQYWPKVAPFADQRISLMPFAYSVPNLLCQCVQEILQFNLFSVDILNKCDVSSESNKLLLDSMYNYLSSANNKELVFCGQDAQYFIKNFRKNFRYFDKGHSSTCGIFYASDSQQSLNSNSDGFGVVPTSHDWNRMISWAVNENGVESGLRNSTQYTHELKPHRNLSEIADSLYSSNFDISSISNLENADWLKWKCYVKFTTSNLCLITVIPDSLDVIKRLINDHKSTNQTMSESVYFNTESQVDIDEIRSSVTTRNNSYSYYTSCSTSSKDLEEQDESIDRAMDTNTFRLRASTWDTMRRTLDSQRNVIDRLRTNSLGARIKPLTRLRPKRSFDLDSRERLSENVFRLTKYVSLILPIYVCKCSLTDVIDYLIYKNDCSHCEDNLKNSEKINFDDDDVIAENLLEEQCSNISEVFTKYFVLSLFKCLHQGYDIPANDIEQAFSKCETSVLTIDITDYLKVVCKHLKNISATLNENNKNIKPSSYFLSSGVCNELKFIHKLIKRKFTNILMSDFKPIISKPEFYFFCPSWAKESKPSSVGILSPGFTESTSVEIHDQIIPVPLGNVLGKNTWETCKESINSEDNACTSLISNMDSDSLNEVSNESFVDDLNPLFLKLNCNIFSENNTAKCAVNFIPTCICEILKQLDKSFDLNTTDFRITLDLLCLTSPYVEIKKKIYKNGISQNSSKTFFPDDFSKTTLENITDFCFENNHIPTQVAQLPDYEYNALNACIAQLKWLMRDEIVTFMLDTSPVTSQTLKMVCDHIEFSSNATTCFIEKVPLSFVFGKEATSLNNFLQDFDFIKIPNYHLKKEKNMYYLIKNYTDKQRIFHKKEFDDHEFPGDTGRIKTSSMEILNEEQENFLQVFSSDESIFESESNRSASFDFTRHGSITDGDEDNIKTMQSTVQWILDRESSDAELPNFWLIMTISEDYVIVYFHCGFLEIKKKEIEDYIIVRETVIRNIKNLCKTVNQKMLLDNLHDTRICNQLLVPDPQQDDNENELDNIIESCHSFIPGYFACDVVWETKFILHPRLKMSPIKGTVSRGIQSLCSALSGFSVTNRKNLFVYKDVNRNVFYLRLYESIHGNTKNHESEETSSGSFSRSSSFTSLSKKQFDEQLPFLLDESKLRNKSFSDASDTNLLKMEDFIILKVYGITEAGTDIKNDLVQVLQNRLDDAVLDVISVMLARNSLCKLLSEDVHFIQKPNQLPNCELQFSLHDWTKKHLYSFRYLVKQNVQLTACIPKYSDPRSTFHFQDYSVPEDSPRRISEYDLFLYNQNPTSGKGIACLAFTIVDANGDTVECTDEFNDVNVKSTFTDIPTFEELKLMADTHLVNKHNLDDGQNNRIEFRIWKQGKINMEILQFKLSSAIKNALWELAMEKNLLQWPMFISDTVNLFYPYYKLIPFWMQFGTEVNVPSVRFWKISIPIRSNMNIILKELNALFLPYETTFYVFFNKCIVDEEHEKDIYQPYLHFDKIVQHNDDTCLIVGRNLSFIIENSDITKSAILETNKSDKIMQRLPSISQDDVQVSVLKQKFILIIISNSELKMYIYNWSKDKFDILTKHMTNLSEWLRARTALLFSIVEQKMGLFYNLPIYRSDLPKKISEMTTSNLDVLLKFPVSFHKTNSSLYLNNIGNTFRDIKFPKTMRDKCKDTNPFIQNVNQLREVQEVDLKVQNKYVQDLWQSKSSSNISLSEEMLNIFSLHGRLIHYCLTPLLFMPSWRVKAAATRVHVLSLKIQADVDELKTDNEDEEWHAVICSNFVKDYKKYLKSMGFFSTSKSNEQFSKMSSNSRDPYETEKKDVHYMQKNLLGGVLLYELSFSEPFFNAKLYAIESARLNTKNNSILSQCAQFTVNFLDECDKIKFQMHLHSFTYDYHLRCLHQFITNQKPLLRHGYHIVDFIDDFMRYYPKAPNYARSLVHTEYVSMNDVTILPTQLFDYLLTYGKNYNMNTFCMMPQYSNDISEENEYVLIRNKSMSAISYKDINDVQQSENFDIIIIISHINDDQENTIKFKIYILITSRKDLYPKLELEQKLGKFRTVSTSYDYASSNDDDIDVKFNFCDDSESSKSSQDLKENKKKKSSHHTEIRQEFVNYLGYYSSHEEAMQNLMSDEVEDAKRFIEWMVVQGTFDCETHILWNKLLCSTPTPLTYQELQHLLSLADVNDISTTDLQLQKILNQPMSWLQSFIKTLMSKLPSCHLFSSVNTQELIILHPQFSSGFVMIILNFQKITCVINLVCRKGLNSGEETQFELQTFFEQIINTYCFHLWLDAL